MLEQIKNANISLEQNNSLLSGNQAGLENENAEWQLKQESYDDLLKELQKELEIVNQCVNVLNNGGVSRA